MNQRSKQELIGLLRAQISQIESSSPLRGEKKTAASKACEGTMESFRPLDQRSVRPDTAGLRKDDCPSYERTKAKVERLCVQRDQNSVLLQKRLVREGFDAAFVEQAVERALEIGLIDDFRWADMIVRSRISAGKGISGIRRELAEGGIDLETLPEWPEGYAVDGQSEHDRALRALLKRPPRAKNKRAAAYRRLVSKGFSYSVAQTVAREWTESLNDSA